MADVGEARVPDVAKLQMSLPMRHGGVGLVKLAPEVSQASRRGDDRMMTVIDDWCQEQAPDIGEVMWTAEQRVPRAHSGGH